MKNSSDGAKIEEKMPPSYRQKQQCCSATGVICYSSVSWLVQGVKQEPERIYYLLSQIQFPPLVSLLFGLWHYRSFSQNCVFFPLVTKKTEVRERKLRSLSFHRMRAKTCKMGDEAKQTYFVEETNLNIELKRTERTHFLPCFTAGNRQRFEETRNMFVCTRIAPLH